MQVTFTIQDCTKEAGNVIDLLETAKTRQIKTTAVFLMFHCRQTRWNCLKSVEIIDETTNMIKTKCLILRQTDKYGNLDFSHTAKFLTSMCNVVHNMLLSCLLQSFEELVTLVMCRQKVQ